MDQAPGKADDGKRHLKRLADAGRLVASGVEAASSRSASRPSPQSFDRSRQHHDVRKRKRVRERLTAGSDDDDDNDNENDRDETKADNSGGVVGTGNGNRDGKEHNHDDDDDDDDDSESTNDNDESDDEDSASSSSQLSKSARNVRRKAGSGGSPATGLPGHKLSTKDTAQQRYAANASKDVASSATSAKSSTKTPPTHANASLQQPKASSKTKTKSKGKGKGGAASGNAGNKTRSGLVFPYRLHQLLSEVEKNGLASVVSWLPSGKSFKVHDKLKFAKQVMPVYFNSTKYKSFQRSLNVWGFECVGSGPDKGAMHQLHFRRDNAELCRLMTRQSIKDPTHISNQGKLNRSQQAKHQAAAAKRPPPAQLATIDKPTRTTAVTSAAPPPMTAVSAQQSHTLPAAHTSASAAPSATMFAAAAAAGGGDVWQQRLAAPGSDFAIQSLLSRARGLPVVPGVNTLQGHDTAAAAAAVSAASALGRQPPYALLSELGLLHQLQQHQHQHAEEAPSQLARNVATTASTRPKPLAGIVGEGGAQFNKLSTLQHQAQLSFSQKLHHILSSESFSSIIAWKSNGRCFQIMNVQQLEPAVLSIEFHGQKAATLTGFLNQLEAFSFVQVPTGKNAGCIYHELMVRGLPHLCRYIATPADARRFVPPSDMTYNFDAVLGASGSSNDDPDKPPRKNPNSSDVSLGGRKLETARSSGSATSSNQSELQQESERKPKLTQAQGQAASIFSVVQGVENASLAGSYSAPTNTTSPLLSHQALLASMATGGAGTESSANAAVAELMAHHGGAGAGILSDDIVSKLVAIRRAQGDAGKPFTSASIGRSVGIGGVGDPSTDISSIVQALADQPAAKAAQAQSSQAQVDAAAIERLLLARQAGASGEGQGLDARANQAQLSAMARGAGSGLLGISTDQTTLLLQHSQQRQQQQQQQQRVMDAQEASQKQQQQLSKQARHADPQLEEQQRQLRFVEQLRAEAAGVPSQVPGFGGIAGIGALGGNDGGNAQLEALLTANRLAGQVEPAASIAAPTAALAQAAALQAGGGQFASNDVFATALRLANARAPLATPASRAQASGMAGAAQAVSAASTTWQESTQPTLQELMDALRNQQR